MPKKPSPQTQAEALEMAKATQRPGQTKDQTKLIAQGVEKGIAEYKKREKAKARERDKQRKKEQRQQQEAVVETPQPSEHQSRASTGWLPWSLLIISWLGFAAYWLLTTLV